MKPSGVLCVLLLGLCMEWSSFKAGGAELGTLQCLRRGRTNTLTACLSCHDGSLARNLKVQPAVQSPGVGSGEHPVPIDYAAAYIRRPQEFVPPALLPREIQLVQGQVQCVSCHSTDAQGNWVPLRLTSGRPLCLGCHRK